MKKYQKINLETFNVKDYVVNYYKQYNEKLEQLLLIENKTWDNFYIPLCYLNSELEEKDVLSKTFLIDHLRSVNFSEKLNNLYNEYVDIATDLYSDIFNREDFYNAVNSLLETELTKEQIKSVNDFLDYFKNNGIHLSEEKRNELKNIKKELNKLTSDFQENVINSEKEYKLIIKDESLLEEFSNSEKELYQKIDSENNKYWEFGLDAPSYTIFMEKIKDSNMRKEMYVNYIKRGLKNEELIPKIINLKNKKSKLIGKENYVSYVLEDRMLNNISKIETFLNNVKNNFLESSVKDKQDILEFAKTIGINDPQLWDMTYIINKFEQKECSLPNNIKEYFSLDNVLNGLFKMLNKMFNLTFELIEEETWDEKVKTYLVYKDNELISKIYMDLETKPNKLSGAWMNSSDTHYIYNGEKSFPIAYIVANFPKSTKNIPSLLNHNDVVTLFHEMGHVLQHICSKVEFIENSGINGIEWDAVEWSSQFFELFAYEKEILKEFAFHFQTNEPISEELLKGIEKTNKFLYSRQTIRQLCFALFDIRVYQTENITEFDVQNILNSVRKELGIDYLMEDKFQCAFKHIFSGGYGVGYYSYKWSEVLSVDTFMEFKNKGFFNKELCNNFWDKFLTKGSSQPSNEMFIHFMNRDVDVNSLKKYYE